MAGIFVVTILLGVCCLNDLVNPVSAREGCISHPLPPEVVDKIVAAANIAISQRNVNNCSSMEDNGETNYGHALATLGYLQNSLSETKQEFSTSKIDLENGLAEIRSTLSGLRNEFAEIRRNHGLVSSKSVKCKDRWFLFQNSCYYFSMRKANWESGRQECMKMGADYVKISSDAEFTFLSSIFEESSWVGLNDLEYEGTFKWVSDGTVETRNQAWWGVGQPDDHGNKEDCVHMLLYKGRVHLNDHECPTQRYYICEMAPQRNIG